jgi:hypothetical protein
MLEQKIDELNKALAANTAAAQKVAAVWELLLQQAQIVQKRVTDGADTVLAAGVTVIDKTVAQDGAASAKKGEPKDAKAAPAKTEEPDKTETSAPDVTLEQLQEVVKAKAVAHRAEVVAVLKSFGAGRVSELPQAKYSDALTSLSAIGAEEELV